MGLRICLERIVIKERIEVDPPILSDLVISWWIHYNLYQIDLTNPTLFDARFKVDSSMLHLLIKDLHMLRRMYLKNEEMQITSFTTKQYLKMRQQGFDVSNNKELLKTITSDGIMIVIQQFKKLLRRKEINKEILVITREREFV